MVYGNIDVSELVFAFCALAALFIIFYVVAGNGITQAHNPYVEFCKERSMEYRWGNIFDVSPTFNCVVYSEQPDGSVKEEVKTFLVKEVA